MNKMKVLVTLLILACGVFVVLLCRVVTENYQLKFDLQQVQSHIQHPYESQQKLKDAGYYHGKIDGIWGEQTKKAYGNWCASQYFKE